MPTQDTPRTCELCDEAPASLAVQDSDGSTFYACLACDQERTEALCAS